MSTLKPRRLGATRSLLGASLVDGLVLRRRASYTRTSSTRPADSPRSFSPAKRFFTALNWTTPEAVQGPESPQHAAAGALDSEAAAQAVAASQAEIEHLKQRLREAEERQRRMESDLGATRLRMNEALHYARDAERRLRNAQRDLELCAKTPTGMTMVQSLSESDLITALKTHQDSLLRVADGFFDALEAEVGGLEDLKIVAPVKHQVWHLAALDAAASKLRASPEAYLIQMVNQIVLLQMAELWAVFVPGLRSDLDGLLGRVAEYLGSSYPDQWVQNSVWRQFTVRQLSGLLSFQPVDAELGCPEHPAATAASAVCTEVTIAARSLFAACRRSAGPSAKSPSFDSTGPAISTFHDALVASFGKLLDLKLRAQTEAGIVQCQVYFQPPPDLPRSSLVPPNAPVCVQGLGIRSWTNGERNGEVVTNEQPVQFGLAKGVLSGSFATVSA